MLIEYIQLVLRHYCNDVVFTTHSVTAFVLLQINIFPAVGTKQKIDSISKYLTIYSAFVFGKLCFCSGSDPGLFFFTTQLSAQSQFRKVYSKANVWLKTSIAFDVTH